jgi:transcriptional regulator with XRE-family HTH domain
MKKSSDFIDKFANISYDNFTGILFWKGKFTMAMDKGKMIQNVASFLKNYRMKHGITGQEMGKIINTSKSNYYHYEMCLELMSLEKLVLLADSLHVSVDTIIGRSANNESMDATINLLAETGCKFKHKDGSIVIKTPASKNISLTESEFLEIVNNVLESTSLKMGKTTKSVIASEFLKKIMEYI